MITTNLPAPSICPALAYFHIHTFCSRDFCVLILQMKKNREAKLSAQSSSVKIGTSLSLSLALNGKGAAAGAGAAGLGWGGFSVQRWAIREGPGVGGRVGSPHHPIGETRSCRDKQEALGAVPAGPGPVWAVGGARSSHAPSSWPDPPTIVRVTTPPPPTRILTA